MSDGTDFNLGVGFQFFVFYNSPVPTPGNTGSYLANKAKIGNKSEFDYTFYSL